MREPDIKGNIIKVHTQEIKNPQTKRKVTARENHSSLFPPFYPVILAAILK